LALYLFFECRFPLGLRQSSPMQLGSFVSTEQVLRDGLNVSQSALPTKDEDRIVVLEFEHGTMIAIFDGLCGARLLGLLLTSLARPPLQ
jgi:hypothetical protein